MKADLTAANILKAAFFAVLVYALAQPFRRFIDDKLDEYEKLERTESEI